MKVMLLMRSDGSYAGGGGAEDYSAWADYQASLEKDGVFLGSGQFADVTGGLSVTTDLTAPESEAGTRAPESAPMNGDAALVGYYLLDCASRDEAVGYARLAPLYGSVEVRELAEY